MSFLSLKSQQRNAFTRSLCILHTDAAVVYRVWGKLFKYVRNFGRFLSPSLVYLLSAFGWPPFMYVRKNRKKRTVCKESIELLAFKANFCPAFEKPLWENEKSFKSCGINKEWFGLPIKKLSKLFSELKNSPSLWLPKIQVRTWSNLNKHCFIHQMPWSYYWVCCCVDLRLKIKARLARSWKILYLIFDEDLFWYFTVIHWV